jgi:uncharacterized coiled-coil protein SlyX
VQILLVVALLLAMVGLALESRRAARLTDEVTALTGRLAEARSALEAHRQRLAEVRGHVAELRGRVESLDDLLQADVPPAPPPHPAP